MQWFAGSVSTAIQVSRKNNALFIVFIESKNAKGEKMRELWDKIEPTLFDCAFVGIHLMEGDEAAKQFAQIYPTPVLPASYIIDNLGKPIEIITLLKDLDYDEFYSKLEHAAKTFTAGKKGGSSGQGTSRSSGDIQQADQPSTSKQGSSSNTSSHSLSLEEKVERAKRLLEEKKKAEEEAAKLREKERELERINEGKLAQEAQKKREEQAIIDAAAQRRRDKIEAEKERQRLIAQIKADREEREYRERLARHADTASAGDMPAQPPPPPKMEPIPSDRCRVQVRLPEGDNIVEEFSSSDCLNTLMELIRQDGRVRGAFSLAQVYPRKVFTEEELQKSYLELCLTPSCTLLVIQKHSKTSNIIAASPFGGVYSLISMLLIAPLQYIYGVVAGWFGWNSSSGSSSSSNQTHQEPKRQREPHEPHGATVRRRGNVTRLHNTNDDSEDDNANWNGNSTQFLRFYSIVTALV